MSRFGVPFSSFGVLVDPGCWDQKQQLDVAATTAAVLLLLCCCCCAAAAVLLLLLLHDPRFIAAPRSAMLIRDAYAEIPEKNVPLRCSISFIWRSGLPRGAGTKNSNFTLPQRVEEL